MNRAAALPPLLAALCFLFLAVPCFAPGAGTTATLANAGILRIGYLRPGTGADLTHARMDDLRRFLLADAGVVAAMSASGFDRIGLYPADGGGDMLRRLDASEFDIAFAPSRTWAEQRAGYRVILQTRRPRDVVATRGRMVLQRGVVFASPRSPLFDIDQPAAGDLRRELSRKRLAAVATQSLPGYLAPVLELRRLLGDDALSGGVLWFSSDAEVAKAVLSGLADIGACEEGALDETLARAGLLADRDSTVRILLRTPPIPTDPVIARPALDPVDSVLGRELKRALRSFSLDHGFGDTSLQGAQDDDYVEVRNLLAEFARPQAVPAAPGADP